MTGDGGDAMRSDAPGGDALTVGTRGAERAERADVPLADAPVAGAHGDPARRSGSQHGGAHRAGPVDWEGAIAAGRRRVRRGPVVTRGEAAAAVAELRSAARRADVEVRRITGLGADLPIADAEVVDRRGWVTAAGHGMAELAKPLTDAMIPDDYRGPSAGPGLGLVLAYLSAHVLGQYDPIGTSPGGVGSGRLLLVAPNIVEVEREIGADPADFRLWVCLHESTHRLQFSAVPWMVGYFRSLIADYATVAPTDAAEFVKGVVAAVTGRTRGGSDDGAAADAGGLMRRIQSPEQRRVFDRITALMTLLEGHADFVMDEVGPAVVPSVAAIRDSFTERRARRKGPLDRIVRAVLGMDAKMAQYARGAAFVRGAVREVGLGGFHRIFESLETLPTMAEIADPVAWVARVHG